MSTKQLQDFGRRVKDLREAKSLSQGELAKRAGLTAANLSRLLAGDRPLRMEQAVALSRALGISVVELTQGTTAENVVRDWVPRGEFDQADRARADAERDADMAKAECEARRSEADSLRESLRSLTQRLAEHEKEVFRLRADVARVEQLSQEKAELTRQVHELRAECHRSRNEGASLKEHAEKAIALANNNYSAWHGAVSRLRVLEGDLTKAHADKVAVGVVTAALAGIAGAILATPATTSKGRSRG